LGEDGNLDENTLPAFERAVLEGAEIIEFDVWTGLSVAHDPGKTTAPKLTEVMDLIAGRCSINIEIKSPAAAPAAMSRIETALESGVWSAKQIILSAFHHETALLCKQTLPQLKVGIINDGVLLPDYIENLHQNGIDNLHLEWANIYMDIEAGYKMREAAHKNNMRIWVWTVNSIDVYETLLAYGVDAIFTDRPDIIGAKKSITNRHN
jgi:glycerophosphoryl diester phosphodiesterase